MKNATPKSFTLSILAASLIACGGGGGSSSDTPASDAGVGGATSTGTCSALDDDIDTSRIATICKIARLAYAEGADLKINSDFEHGEAQGYPAGKKHTGIDVKAQDSFNGGPLKSIVTGVIVGFDSFFGSVIIDTNIGGREVQIAYLHLENIPTSLYVGLEVQVGTVLGDEGRTGLADNIGKHWHIEIRDLQMTQNRSLDNLITSAASWELALDPYAYFEDIANANTSVFNNPVIHVTFPSVIEYPNAQKLSGYAYNRQGIEDVVEFTLLDDANNVLSSETHHPTRQKSGRILPLSVYHFGSESVLKDPGYYQLRTTVKSSENNTLETSTVFNFQMTDATQPETLFEPVLANDYFYVGDTRILSGCIHDPDGIFSLKYKTTYPNFNTVVQELTELDSSGCNGTTGSIDLSDGDNKYEPGTLPIGNFSTVIEAMDDKGVMTNSDPITYEVKNQVASIETPNNLIVGSMNEYIIHRIPNDPNYHKTVNLPSCLYLEVDGTSNELGNNFEQNAEDGGLYRLTSNKFFDVSAGAKSYRLYHQCASESPQIDLLTGIFTFRD